MCAKEWRSWSRCMGFSVCERERVWGEVWSKCVCNEVGKMSFNILLPPWTRILLTDKALKTSLFNLTQRGRDHAQALWYININIQARSLYDARSGIKTWQEARTQENTVLSIILSDRRRRLCLTGKSKSHWQGSEKDKLGKWWGNENEQNSEERKQTCALQRLQKSRNTKRLAAHGAALSVGSVQRSKVTKRKVKTAHKHLYSEIKFYIYLR